MRFKCAQDCFQSYPGLSQTLKFFMDLVIFRIWPVAFSRQRPVAFSRHGLCHFLDQIFLFTIAAFELLERILAVYRRPLSLGYLKLWYFYGLGHFSKLTSSLLAPETSSLLAPETSSLLAPRTLSFFGPNFFFHHWFFWTTRADSGHL